MRQPHLGALRAIVPCPGGGHCLMSGFPGLETAVDGTAWIDPEGLRDTLAAICAAGAIDILVCTEEEELPEGAMDLLSRAAASTGLHLNPLPVQDFSVPAADTLRRWDEVRPRLYRMLDAGGAVAFCCQYGAGRSGTLTAMVLIERGATPETAIRTVREAFNEAIENPVQEQWLYDLTPTRAFTCPASDQDHAPA